MATSSSSSSSSSCANHAGEPRSPSGEKYFYFRITGRNLLRLQQVVEQHEKHRAKMREKSQSKSANPRGKYYEDITFEDVTCDYAKLVAELEQLKSLYKELVALKSA